MKKGKRYVLIIIFILVLVGLIGVLAYIKLNKPVPKQHVIRMLNTNETKEIERQVNVYNSYLSEKYSISDIDKLDNQIILNFAVKNIENATNGFSKRQVNNVIKKYFGNELKYKNEDINCYKNDGVLYKYNKKTKTYTFTGAHEHEPEGMDQSKSYYLDGSYDKTDSIYLINTKVLYGSHTNDVSGPVTVFYKDSGNKDRIYEVDANNVNDWIQNFNSDKYDEVYEKVKDELPVTTYVLKKDSEGNIGLIKVSREKK